MARKPTALALAMGRDIKNPQRYRDLKKNEPTGLEAVGDPPDYIVDKPDCLARSAWKAFTIEIPWMTQADRAILEAASLIRGDVMAGQAVGVPRLTLLRNILQSLGATPSDKAKIVMPAKPDKKEEEEDIFNEG